MIGMLDEHIARWVQSMSHLWASSPLTRVRRS